MPSVKLIKKDVILNPHKDTYQEPRPHLIIEHTLGE